MEAPNGKANCGKKSGRLYPVVADGAAVPVALLWAPFDQAPHTLTQILKLSLLVQSLVPIHFSRFSSYYVSSKYYFPFPTPLLSGVLVLCSHGLPPHHLPTPSVCITLLSSAVAHTSRVLPLTLYPSPLRAETVVLVFKSLISGGSWGLTPGASQEMSDD